MTIQTSKTLDFNLACAKSKRAGVVATMAAIDAVKAKSLRKDSDYGLHEIRANYALPHLYDFGRANSEIKRLDWIIGLIEKDIRKRDRVAKAEAKTAKAEAKVKAN